MVSVYGDALLHSGRRLLRPTLLRVVMAVRTSRSTKELSDGERRQRINAAVVDCRESEEAY